MNPHNYPAIALRCLRILMESTAPDKNDLLYMANQITDAQHFVVPPGGAILNDGWKAIEGAHARIPFRTITISVPPPSDNLLGLLIIADELSYGDDNFIEVRVLPQLEPAASAFDVCPLIGRLPFEWEHAVSSLELREILPNICTKFMAQLSGEQERKAVAEHFQDTILAACRGVLELCEALSCSNVSHIVSQKAASPERNAKRERKGKLPILESRILVVEAPGGIQEVGPAGAPLDRRGPRQHLRRGHIRRLPGRNVWVQPCVVGSAANGFVNKDYDVRAARCS